MPFDGSGNYTPPVSPAFPAITNTNISSSYYNQVINDLAAAMSMVLTRDGQGKPSGPIGWNNQNLSAVNALSAQSLAIAANGSVSGYLGVGITTPTLPLQVVSSGEKSASFFSAVSASPASYDAGECFSLLGTATSGLTFTSSDSRMLTFGVAPDDSIYIRAQALRHVSSTGHYWSVANSTNSAMVLTSAGYFGLGTASPTMPFQAVGQSNIGYGVSQVAAGSLTSANLSTYSAAFLGGTGGNFLLSGQFDVGSLYTQWLQSAFTTSGSSTIYNLCLQPIGGYVGIGIAAPVVPLDVNGTIRSVAASGQIPALLLNNTTGTSWKANVRFQSNGATKFEIGTDPGTAGADTFYIYNQATSQNVLVITSGGSITIPAVVDTFGYKGLPQNYQTSGYTLAFSDMGKHISITTGGVTIPANSSVAFPIGSAITIFNNSSSNQSISITTDTLYQAGTSNTGTRTLAGYGLATLLKVAATTWVIAGSGVT